MTFVGTTIDKNLPNQPKMEIYYESPEGVQHHFTRANGMIKSIPTRTGGVWSAYETASSGLVEEFDKAKSHGPLLLL